MVFLCFRGRYIMHILKWKLNAGQVLWPVFLCCALLAGCRRTGADPVIYQVVSTPSLQPGDPIPAPVGETLLTVEGKIENGPVALDLHTLETMGLVSYAVDDPFEKRTRVFTGVLLSDLLDVVGVDEAAVALELVALNDYSAGITLADVRKYPILFSVQADGAYYEPSQGGPAIIIIPFDDYRELDHLEYDPRWVWSMTKIIVK